MALGVIMSNMSGNIKNIGHNKIKDYDLLAETVSQTWGFSKWIDSGGYSWSVSFSHTAQSATIQSSNNHTDYCCYGQATSPTIDASKYNFLNITASFSATNYSSHSRYYSFSVQLINASSGAVVASVPLNTTSVIDISNIKVPVYLKVYMKAWYGSATLQVSKAIFTNKQ